MSELCLSTLCRLPQSSAAIGGSYHAKKRPVWLCPACKVCPQCEKLLPASSAPGSWCQSCAYPPCVGCQKVARPRKQRYHATQRPFWRCAECAHASCPMCQANPIGPDAGGGPDAACPECAERGPRCAVCQQPMLDRPHSHGWCHGCAFPPCAAGCGAPRPSTHAADHAKFKPEWTCQTCYASDTGPAKRRKIQKAEQADTLPPLPPPAEPLDDSASPAAPFSQPKRRKAQSRPTGTAPCATAAQTTPALCPADAGAVPQPPDDSSVSRPAVLLCQPRKRKRGVASANLESSLPAPVPETVLPDS